MVYHGLHHQHVAGPCSTCTTASTVPRFVPIYVVQQLQRHKPNIPNDYQDHSRPGYGSALRSLAELTIVVIPIIAVLHENTQKSLNTSEGTRISVKYRNDVMRTIKSLTG